MLLCLAFCSSLGLPYWCGWLDALVNLIFLEIPNLRRALTSPSQEVRRRKLWPQQSFSPGAGRDETCLHILHLLPASCWGNSPETLAKSSAFQLLAVCLSQGRLRSRVSLQGCLRPDLREAGNWIPRCTVLYNLVPTAADGVVWPSLE